MKAKIVGTNIEVTSAMKKAIESSLKKLDKFECFSDNTPCVVTVRTVKEDQIIEVSIFLSNKKIIRCERRADSLYDAINMAEKTLSRILRKEKEKMEQRKGIKTIHSADIFDVPEKQLASIVKSKVVPLNMLDTDEAIDEMENLDHDFHLFLHKSNGSPCVLYRRIDGDYGILIGKTE